MNVERYISYYGDGAVLDCARNAVDCRVDTEPDWGDTCPNDYSDTGEYPDPAPSCIVRVVMPKADYLDIWYYCHRDNMGPNPLSDAYEAAQIVAIKAVETEVIQCDSPWTPEECDRLDGCYLCGGDHRNLGRE